jgi:hypothetical protein
MKKNFVYASLASLILSAALITFSFPIHPPILINSEEQVTYEEMNFPIHPPILSSSENQVVYIELSFPIHPPILL